MNPFEASGAPLAFSTEVLARESSWVKLLHYRPSVWGGFYAEVESREFYLATGLQPTPQQELEADIEAFTAHPEKMCLFPARAQWLKSHGVTLPATSCDELTGWKARVNAHTVSLIFSSYYQSSPASMFGHTFLRFNSGNDDSVLNHALEYAAMTSGEPMILQGPKGLFGAYEGGFQMTPYYIKIKEYSNAEHRDIFEYALAFSADDVERLLDHVWEMRRAHLKYFFIHRNCSYEILALIEAVRPELELVSQVRYAAIPIDTVRALTSLGLIQNVHYRPSISRRLEAKWNHLSSAEQDQYFDLINRKIAPDKVASAKLAEAAGLFFMNRQVALRGDLPKDEAVYFHDLNVRRSELPSLNDDPAEIPEPVRPDLAHLSSRLAVGGGGGAYGSFMQWNWRPALHNLVENDNGYTPNSQLEFFNVNLRSSQAAGLAVNELSVFHATALTPLSRLFHGISYDVQAGWLNPFDLASSNSGAGHLHTGVGFSFSLPFENALVFGFLKGVGEVSSAFSLGYRLGLGPELGLILPITKNAKILLQAEQISYASQPSNGNIWKLDFQSSYCWSQKTETQAQFTAVANVQEGLISQAFYF